MRTLSLSYSFVCPGNKVVFNASDSGTPLNGVALRVIYDEPPYFFIVGSPTTGSDGLASLTLSDNGNYHVYADADGYVEYETDFDFTTCSQQAGCQSNGDCPASQQCTNNACVPVTCDCGQVLNHSCQKYACCSDSACPSGQVCDGHVCKQKPGCVKDADCDGNQYCSLPTGAASGTCTDVTGCGKIENHALTPYQCGTEPGCPSCPQGQQCENHVCYQRNLTAPQNNTVGTNVTVHVTENTGPCRLCDLSIKLPDGTTITGRTDENGNYPLALTLPGNYTVTLLKGGQPIRTITVNALPMEQPAAQLAPVPNDVCLIGAIILLLLIVLVIIWRRRKKKQTYEKKK